MNSELLKKVLYILIIILAIAASIKLYLWTQNSATSKQPVLYHKTATPTKSQNAKTTPTITREENTTDTTNKDLDSLDQDLNDSVNELDNITDDLNNLE